MATVEHDFTDHDQMSTPKPADNIGDVGFGDFYSHEDELAATVRRRGELLNDVVLWAIRMGVPRGNWSPEVRNLIEKIEAELGVKP